jgi:SH3-like domain-containing protein
MKTETVHRCDTQKMKRLWITLGLLLVFAANAGAAERWSVKASRANIRSGPGTKHAKLWAVWKHYPIRVLKKQGVWFYFEDYEHDQGWIHKSLLTKDKTVITTRKTCNIRSGPGTKHDVVMTVADGISFKVVKRKGNWIQIEHADGDNGWIHKSLVW